MDKSKPLTTQVHYPSLKRKLKLATDKDSLYKAIVDTPFNTCQVETALLFLGILILLITHEETNTIDMVALSDTALAKGTTDMSVERFQEIKIPLDDSNNIVAQTIRTSKHHDVADWQYLFVPCLTPEQSRINQSGGGIGFSCVYPLNNPKTSGALIFNYYQFSGKIQPAQRQFMREYTKLVSNSLANQK